MKTLLIFDPAPPKRDYIIKQLLEKGHTCIGVSPIKEGSGLNLCQHKIVRQFFEIEDILKDLEECPKVDGIICFHQAAISFANLLAHRIQVLPLWENPEIDLANKKEVNQIWRDAGLNIPQTYTLDELENGDDPFPVIMKPSNLQGSIGVKQCHNTNEAIKWSKFLKELRLPFSIGTSHYDMIDLYQSDTSPFIQEKVMATNGWEFENSVEFIVQEGQIKTIGFIDKRIVKNEDYFLESLFAFPATTPVEQFEEELKKYVSALGITNSQVHLEFKIRDNQVFPIEINCRAIGEPMAKLLFSHLQSPISNTLTEIALGSRVSLKPKKYKQGWTGFAFIHPSSSQRESYKFFSGIEFEKIKNANIEFVSAYEVGEQIVWDESLHSFPIGHFVFSTTDENALKELKDNLLDSVKLLS